MADHGQPPPTSNLQWPRVRTQRESDGSCRCKEEVRPREGSPMPGVTQQANGTAGAGMCWSLDPGLPVGTVGTDRKGAAALLRLLPWPCCHTGLHSAGLESSGTLSPRRWAPLAGRFAAFEATPQRHWSEELLLPSPECRPGPFSDPIQKLLSRTQPACLPVADLPPGRVGRWLRTPISPRVHGRDTKWDWSPQICFPPRRLDFERPGYAQAGPSSCSRTSWASPGVSARPELSGGRGGWHCFALGAKEEQEACDEALCQF